MNCRQFKLIEETDAVQGGERYINLFVNVIERTTYIFIYRLVKDPYLCSKNSETNQLKVDCYRSTLYGEEHFSQGIFVSDMVGVYGPVTVRKKQLCSNLYSINLFDKGLFVFSDELLEHLKTIHQNWIESLKFLNPEEQFNSDLLLNLNAYSDLRNSYKL